MYEAAQETTLARSSEQTSGNYQVVQFKRMLNEEGMLICLFARSEGLVNLYSGRFEVLCSL